MYVLLLLFNNLVNLHKVTGCIRPGLVDRLNPNDAGGQYDSDGGMNAKGNPTGSKCIGLVSESSVCLSSIYGEDALGTDIMLSSLSLRVRAHASGAVMTRRTVLLPKVRSTLSPSFIEADFGKRYQGVPQCHTRQLL